jgi:WD40 repeat protein
MLIWDVAARRLVKALGGLDAAVNALAFDVRDSNLLFAGGEDNQVRRWDVALGTPR